MTDGADHYGARVVETLRGAFLENTHLKLIAMLLTLALYLWVGADRITRVVAVPIKLSVPADQVLLEPKIEQVKVTLEGSSSALDRFAERKNKVMEVELSKSNDGQLLALPHTALETPAGLRVVKIEPSFVRVEMAEKQKKNVPIRPRLAGSLNPSYEVAKVTVEPSTVTVQGPRDVIADLEAIPTEPIDLSDRKESFQTIGRLRPESPLIRYELDEYPTISVEIRVETERRTLSKIGVRAVNTTHAAEITPSTVDATVRGPQASVEQLETSEILAVVDVSTLEDEPPGTFDIEPELRNLPGDVETLKIRPKQVVVTLRPAPAETDPRPETTPEPDAGSGD